jgi:hypothetical protein
VLSFNDTTSAVLNVTLASNGGAGGNANAAGSAGGNASTAGTISGAGVVQILAGATGGAGGMTPDFTQAGGGNAAISMTATGSAVYLQGDANAGAGGGAFSGGAAAFGAATGSTGMNTMDANTGLNGGLVTVAQASGMMMVDGLAEVQAYAGIGATFIPYAVGADTSVANLEGAPTASSAKSVLKGDSKSLAAFGAGTTFLAVGQFAAAHSAAGNGTSETVNDTLTFRVDTSKLAMTNNLKIAFVGGKDAGAGGITDVHVTVLAGGVDVVDQDFTSAANAVTWFNDNPVTLGALASFANGNMVDISVLLSVTSTGTASTFAGNVVLGNASGGVAAARPVEHGFDAVGRADFVAHHFGVML